MWGSLLWTHEVGVVFAYQEDQAERGRSLPRVTWALRAGAVGHILSAALPYGS